MAVHSEELKARICAMWLGGQSAGHIRQRLYSDGTDLTRNAIIGVINRAGKRRVGYHPTVVMARKIAAPKPPKPTPPPEDAPPILGSVRESVSGCKMMYGEPTADFRYCGQPTERGSWCNYHRSKVFAK